MTNKYERISRRNLFKRIGAGAVSVAGTTLAASSDSQISAASKPRDFFSANDIVLFQGDSITDAGRNRENKTPNSADAFGRGYALLIASHLLAEQAAKKLTFYNRGISGNKVFQLAERWNKDCIDLKPNVLSILIGVNDYWHFRNGKYDGTPAKYESDFTKLLTRTKESLPEVKLIICQPFILTQTSAVDESWVKPFSKYQSIASEIANEFGAVWIPFQEAFDKAANVAPTDYWAADGVHPTMAGVQLMAETWLEAVE